MKSVMIAVTALVAMTGMAMAETPTFVGYSEYAVEANSFEIGAGAELYVLDGFYLTPMVIGNGDVDAFDFTRAEVKATYVVNENIDVYGKIKTDADFNYDDAVVGVAFRF